MPFVNRPDAPGPNGAPPPDDWRPTDADDPRAPPSKERPAVIEAEQIFAELPPIPWVCEAIELAPGAPTMLAGYGYAGKTMLAQDLALAVASGQPAWGCLSVRQGRVIHLDYEQGSYLTRRRYQRLAAARELTPQDLDLALVCRSPIYLDEPEAEEWLTELLTGAAMVVVDPLRAAAPSTEENASQARRPLDLLARVSEHTGCTALVIHHARKPQAEAPGGARMSIRGSSALYDACQSVLVAEAEVGQPTRLAHTKAKLTGREATEMAIKIRDVSIDGIPKAGLTVTAEEAEDVAETSNSRMADAMPRVQGVIQAHPGIGITRLREECRPMRNPIVDACVEALVEAGSVLDLSDGKRNVPRKFMPAPGADV